jgi:trans-aconitate methyltransferase
MLSAYVATLKAQLPPNARCLVQVGCGDGALVAAYKLSYPASNWHGVERDAEAAARARRHCDLVHQADVDKVGAAFFDHFAMADCWIFEQTLAHSADPLALLLRLRAVLAADACLAIVGAEADAAALAALLRTARFVPNAPLVLAPDALWVLTKAVPA